MIVSFLVKGIARLYKKEALPLSWFIQQVQCFQSNGPGGRCWFRNRFRVIWITRPIVKSASNQAPGTLCVHTHSISWATNAHTRTCTDTHKQTHTHKHTQHTQTLGHSHNTPYTLPNSESSADVVSRCSRWEARSVMENLGRASKHRHTLACTLEAWSSCHVVNLMLQQVSVL